MIFKYKELKKRYESLLIGHKHLLKESVKQDEEIKAYRLRIAQLEFEKRALQDALKIASQETEVDYWKTVLDDDIDKYILKEGEDGPEEQKTHCHCGGSCKDTE